MPTIQSMPDIPFNTVSLILLCYMLHSGKEQPYLQGKRGKKKHNYASGKGVTIVACEP